MHNHPSPALTGIAFALLCLILSGCGRVQDVPPPPAQPAVPAPAVDEGAVKPYPLDTCLVSGEPLGSMGEPVKAVHKGQEFKFCCGGCIPEFEANPDSFLAKLEEALDSGAGQDAPGHEGHDHEGHDHEEGGD